MGLARLIHYFEPSIIKPRPDPTPCRCGQTTWGEAVAWWRSAEGLRCITTLGFWRVNGREPSEMIYCQAP